MKKCFCTIFAVLALSVLFAQESSTAKIKYFNLTEVGIFYGSNVRNYKISANYYGNNSDAVSVFNIRNINSIYVFPNLSLGLGLGYGAFLLKRVAKQY